MNPTALNEITDLTPELKADIDLALTAFTFGYAMGFDKAQDPLCTDGYIHSALAQLTHMTEPYEDPQGGKYSKYSQAIPKILADCCEGTQTIDDMMEHRAPGNKTDQLRLATLIYLISKASEF